MSRWNSFLIQTSFINGIMSDPIGIIVLQVTVITIYKRFPFENL